MLHVSLSLTLMVWLGACSNQIAPNQPGRMKILDSDSPVISYDMSTWLESRVTYIQLNMREVNNPENDPVELELHMGKGKDGLLVGNFSLFPPDQPFHFILDLDKVRSLNPGSEMLRISTKVPISRKQSIVFSGWTVVLDE